MDITKKKIEEAQKIRKDINNIVNDLIKPKREMYDKLLNEVAEILCPFKNDEIITRPNNKKVE